MGGSKVGSAAEKVRQKDNQELWDTFDSKSTHTKKLGSAIERKQGRAKQELGNSKH